VRDRIGQLDRSALRRFHPRLMHARSRDDVEALLRAAAPKQL
jgi:hypothetical protein